MTASSASGRVFALLDEVEQPKPAISPVTPEHFGGTLRVDGLSFSYQSRPNTPVLKQLNLDLAPGKVTAVTGASGAGKSECALPRTALHCLGSRLRRRHAGVVAHAIDSWP